MKKVSVIVPVYNVEKYIDKCLNSLVNQTLEDIEIIVVNDGSPDNSQEIIDKYVKDYPNKVKSYIKENGGQGSARNYGLKYATGEYVGYVDSDDYVNLDMYEKMYKCAKTTKSDVVICGNNVISIEGALIKEESAIIYSDTKLDILFGKMAVWNKLYKKDFLVKKNIEFRSKVWYEDIDFTVKVLFDDIKISFINENLYNYLLRPGSTMNNSNVSKNLDILLAFDEMIKYLKNNKLYEKNQIELEFLAVYHIYISAITRVINANVKKSLKKEVINKLKNYMECNFPNYRKNKYLKNINRNKTIVYKLINLKQYWLVRSLFKIKDKK